MFDDINLLEPSLSTLAGYVGYVSQLEPEEFSVMPFNQ